MGVRNNRKAPSVLLEAETIASKKKRPFVRPEVLFSRVSQDDLQLFSAASLAATAVLAESEIRAWDGKKSRMSLVDAAEPTLDGQDVTVLAITTLNKPFLYDSVMGEVTSHIRDIFMALHPILVVKGKEPVTLFSHGDGSDHSHRVSHIQIHMPRLGKPRSRNSAKGFAMCSIRCRLPLPIGNRCWR